MPVPYEALRTPPSAPGPRRRTAVAGGGDDIGGGLNIFLAHAIGVRGDIRHLHTLQDITLGLFSNDQIDFWRASAGLTLRF